MIGYYLLVDEEYFFSYGVLSVLVVDSWESNWEYINRSIDIEVETETPTHTGRLALTT